MTLAPLALASLLQLTSAPSTCEQYLACGEFDGRATQLDVNLNGATITEDFRIADVAPGTVRITELTRNLQNKRYLWSQWEWTFAADGTFTMREFGLEHDDQVVGGGSCENQRCTFRFGPARALAAGAFTFDKDGFTYWIGENAPGEGGFSARTVRVSRKLKPITP